MRTTKISPYRSGEVRFGSREHKPFDNSVTTRQMTPEEIDKVWGGRDVLTKDIYMDLKAQGKSDRQIMDQYDLKYNHFYERKKQWDLVGKSGPAVKEKEIHFEEKLEPEVLLNATPQPTVFQEIALNIADTLERKNHDYGDSFGKLYREFGDMSVLIRLTDKLERFKTLIHNEQLVEDESIEDTLRDIAGYAVLTLKEKQKIASGGEVKRR